MPFSLFGWERGFKSPPNFLQFYFANHKFMFIPRRRAFLLTVFPFVGYCLGVCFLTSFSFVFPFWYHAHQPNTFLISLQPHSFVFVRPTISKIIQKAFGHVLVCLRRAESCPVLLGFPFSKKKKTQTWRKRFRFKSHYISKK